MVEIISVNSLTSLSKTFKQRNRTCVLVGGCFDVLHPGHVIFLEKAKKWGDILIVLLESDEKVKKLKGKNRPIYNQKERAKLLAALRAVDYVVMLPYLEKDEHYDELVGKIRPDVIAVTSKDGNTSHHQRTARLVGAKLKFVTKVVANYSTTRLLGR